MRHGAGGGGWQIGHLRYNHRRVICRGRVIRYIMHLVQATRQSICVIDAWVSKAS